MDDNIDIIEKPEIIEKDEIEHIVIAGGGINGFSYYGILRESEQCGIWNIKNIKTIWGTSAGAMLAVLIAIKIDWNIIDEYLIKRPWENVFSYNLYSLINANDNCGIFDVSKFHNIFNPLLKSKDIDININMQELFNITNIEIHLITTDVSTFQLVDISHKTHPTWKIIDAIYTSSAIPILFKPLLIDNRLYCDGFFNSNYPIQQCIDSGISPNNVMGICPNIDGKINDINEQTTLFDYIIYIFIFIIFKFIFKPTNFDINIEYKIKPGIFTIESFTNAISDPNERIRLIKYGSDFVKATQFE